MSDKRLHVTEPFMPALEEFLPYLEEIWDSRVITNNGPLHQRFEQALAEYLQVPRINLVANGTLALVVALQALKIEGEVITTPYSFVATSNALLWNKLRPVFVDIRPDTCNLDPGLIEAAITPDTSAILAVHTYGTPCDVAAIQKVADRHGLKVIYDAAHAFNVRLDGESLLTFGDLSTISFHATKVFHTVEGGAIYPSRQLLKEQVDFLKNFGFANETTVTAPGINAKMNEMSAAMGLLQLRYADQCIARRLAIAARYREALAPVDGLRTLQHGDNVRWNGAYFPVFLEALTRDQRDAVYEAMKRDEVYGRRYFYPLLTDFPMYGGIPSAAPENLPNARKIADSVICLPIYPTMTDGDVERVIAS
ncbi:MAG: DegT/DnrJ/EryC1/StrS family aminotransferase, partial [Halieaceae bacterium]|nr:DegT/DnrJ/EryC1/StrS family aminotransferase [Halieaceae bacterium]